MPKKKVSASADARTSAASLIAAKRAAGRTPPPSAAALAELRELCNYNDSVSKQADRVGAADAVRVLRSHGWTGAARTALDSVCREHLGRRSYGTP